MGELKHVVVDAISLVKAGANGEPIQIYKSAEQPELEPVEVEKAEIEKPEVETEVDPEIIITEKAKMDETIENKTHSILRKMFAPIIEAFSIQTTEPTIVSKASDIDTSMDYSSFLSRMTNPESLLEEAMYTLKWSINSIFWDDRISDGKERIFKNIDDFKDYVGKVLESDRSIQTVFFEKGDDGIMLKKEDIMAVIKESLEPITKSVDELSTKLDTLQKEEVVLETEIAAATTVDAVIEKAEGTEELKGEDFVNLIKAAVSESLTPITKSIEGLQERIGVVESIRGLSKGASVEKPSVINKSTDDEWPAIKIPGIDF